MIACQIQAFNNEEAYIYIKSTDTYNEVREQLVPLLKDIDKFDATGRAKRST